MSQMQTHVQVFDEQLGSSNEIYVVTFEYCEDFNGDGFDDIRVTVELADSSNSGTEDLIGIAFDIQNDQVAGLTIEDIQTSTSNGTASSFAPTAVIGANQVSDNNGFLDPGFNTSGGGTDEPYDVGIQFSAQGAGEGIVQSASFVIASAGADLDAETLLENTDWWVRTQSTDGGEESAKTGGFVLDLPACECDEEEPDLGPGSGNTPGFWKNHRAIFQQETGLGFGESYEEVFSVDVVGSKKVSDDPTLREALAAKGGGEAALLRASTAGYANAASDDVNYVIDEEALAFATGETGADLDEILSVLALVDANGDRSLSTDEIVAAVQDVYDDPDATGSDDFGWRDRKDLASALDAMNNMPSVETADFMAA